MKITICFMALLFTFKSFSSETYSGIGYQGEKCIINVELDSTGDYIDEIVVIEGSYRVKRLFRPLFEGYRKASTFNSITGKVTGFPVKEWLKEGPEVAEYLLNRDSEREIKILGKSEDSVYGIYNVQELTFSNGYKESIEIGEAADESGFYEGKYRFRKNGLLKSVSIKAGGPRYRIARTKFVCSNLKKIKDRTLNRENIAWY